MSTDTGDNWIDNELRNVAVPADLLSKLQAIHSLGDAELDRALCDVMVPPALIGRLQSIGTLSDNDLDDELRDIAPPRRFAERLLRIPALARHSATRVQTIHRFAIAACLLLAVGVGYLAAIAWNQDRQAGNRPTDSVAAAQAKRSANGGKVDSIASRANDRQTDNINDELSDPKLAPLPPWNELARESAEEPAKNSPESKSPRLAGPPDAIHEPNFDSVSDEGALAAPGAGIESLPPLRSLAEPAWGGVTPPRAPGYDWSFQLKHGVHPFVSPSINPALAKAQVPLVTSTASFDAARESTRNGKLPPAHRIRPEEFLAAMDYRFAPPDGRQVAIRTAAGASPWHSSDVNLLQVAVQAGDFPRDGKPTHIVVLLDASESMQWESRWENALRGLADFSRTLGPSDRLSLILAAERPEIELEGAAAEAARSALESLANRQPSSTCDVAAAILKGIELGHPAHSAAERTQLVLLTDGITALSDAASKETEQSVKDAADRSLSLHVIDLRQEKSIDPQLSRLATVASASSASKVAGKVRHANAASEIRWSLAEVLAGRPQVVAAQASMTVTFKPDAVAMYRLIGHEATSVVGLMSTTIEADLRSNEAATGLFEVVLKPTGGDTVATVELTWRDPASGQPQAISQTISRFQFGPSFHEAPLPLQLAALASQTSEILRDSYFAPANSHSLADVAQLARELNPRLQGRESFVRLLELVERAQRSQASSR